MQTIDTQPEPTTRAEERRPVGARTLALAALALVAVMLGGIFALGNLASDQIQAMVLTTAFFGVVGLVLLRLTWRRWRALVTLGVVYAVVAGAAGVVLGLPLLRDSVVDEEVIQVAPAPPAEAPADEAPADEAPVADAPADEEPAQPDEPADEEPGPAADAPVAVAAGTFESRVHPGEGTATLVDVGDGSRVLTLTDFATDNGPDLFVYLVPADAPVGTVDGFVDLGRLKGNVGDQQYDVPADLPAGEGWRVVVWCRAFTVNFTEATLV